jgi:tRNA (guanine-N7-)-methyltransferase
LAGETSRKADPGHRFFGRRIGHSLSSRQRSLLASALPAVAIEIDLQQDQAIDVSALFSGKHGRFWLEIGFGKGEHLEYQAKANPNVGIIGCDPFINGVVGLLDRIEANDLDNVRIYPDDARNLMARLPEGCLDRVFLIHPDPWPKKRHARRRFVDRDNLDQLARIMADGAELRIGTDHADYAQTITSRMAERDDFIWLTENACDWHTAPADWPETRYASKAREQGNNCFYFRFARTRDK